jgi:hypothetical protein
MRGVLRVLGCCAVLAGCAEAEAEVATKAVDLSKPVPPYTFFVTCGPLDGITMYPVPLPGKYTVEGKYRLSSSRNDLSVADYAENKMAIWGIDDPVSDERVIVNIPNSLNDREAGTSTNFFLLGFANGCAGVFAADIVDLMRADRPVGQWEHHLTHSPTSDDLFASSENEPANKLALGRNALCIRVFTSRICSKDALVSSMNGGLG